METPQHHPDLCPCTYCRKDLSLGKWISEWDLKNDHHYKSCLCRECGRKNWLKVDFSGSGHDLFMKTETSLESALKEDKDKS